jgi:inosine-uridine nucleoside N-ribohydrolase
MTAPRMRIVVDNDFSGDPDGLVQLAHHALSPSVDLRLVIGSRLGPDAREILALAGRDDVPVRAGSNAALADRTTPVAASAARALVAEAMRDDVGTPLYVCAGAGLTEMASAWLIEPRIAERLALVWIGGPEHPGLAVPPPGAMPIEYNLLIDVLAASVVFGDSSIPIWQVPRDAYRQTLASFAELRLRMAGQGPLGERLFAALDGVRTMAGEHGELGEVPRCASAARVHAHRQPADARGPLREGGAQADSGSLRRDSLTRRRSRSDSPPQIPKRSSLSSAYSRHCIRTGQPTQTRLASRVEPPFSGKNASGSVSAHSASCRHDSSPGAYSLWTTGAEATGS